MTTEDKPSMTSLCIYCGRPFEKNVWNQQHCTRACYLQARYKKRRDATAARPLLVKRCEWCGNKFTPKRTHPSQRFCKTSCQIESHKYRLRMESLIKLANGGPIKCSICGCPHSEILGFGHYNGDGAIHRREIGHGTHGLRKWIKENPLEMVLKKVRIECAYCNAYHAWTGKYPSFDKRPVWGDRAIFVKEND